MMVGAASITLIGISYLDLMSGLTGSFFYQIVWNALHACGVTVFPFLVYALNALKQNYESDDLNDKPDQQSRRIIVKFFIGISIMLLAAAPMLKVTGMSVQMQLRTCDKVDVVDSSLADDWLTAYLTTGYANTIATTLNGVFEMSEAAELSNEKQALDRLNAQITMAGEEIRVPIWWNFWRKFMQALGAMITAQLPCDNGLRALKHEISTHFIRDKELAEDLGSFMGQCTIKAKAELQAANGGMAVSEEAMLPNYMFYQSTFYERIRATKPVWGFGMIEDEKGFDPVKSPNSAKPSNTPDGYGYPLCADWWGDSKTVPSKPISSGPPRQVFRGLEERLFEYYGLKDPEQCGKFIDILRIGYQGMNCDGQNGLSQSAVLTAILKEQLLSQSKAAIEAQRVFSKHMGTQAQLGSNNESPDGNSFTQSLFGYTMDIGLITSAFSDFSGNLALLKALPAATSILILLVTAMLPIGMIIGRYELEPLMGLTITYCGFYLWIPYFRMVTWLDDHFVSMVVSSYQVTTMIMMEMMIAVGYLAVPMILGAIITTAGVRVAQLDPIGGDKMGSIANKGAKNLQNTTKFLGGKMSPKSPGKGQ